MKTVLFLCLFGILFFAIAPGQFTPAYIINHDKETHAVVFFVLSYFAHYSFKSINIYRMMLLVFSFGLFIETIQFLLTKREFSIEDLIYDSIGIVLYMILRGCVHFFYYIYSKEQQYDEY